MNLELSALEIIEGRKKAPLCLFALRAAGHFMEAGVHLRHFAYDQNLFATHRVSTPVMSVGNILAGGCGKTPFICFLSEKLAKTGKIAILTRGYRSQAEKETKPRLVQEEDDAALCGDEALLLKRKFPHIDVIAGRDRVAGALAAEERGAKLILLDDGMQHRALHRDVEFVLLPASDPLGEGPWKKSSFLPGGLLRDSPRRLGAADLLVFTGVAEEEEFLSLQKRVAPYSSAPVVGMKERLLHGEKIAGKKIALFCGIARPQRLISAVEALGCEIVHLELSPDHLPLPSLALFEERAQQKGADCLVCTEKDVVKMPPNSFVVLGVELVPAFLEHNLDSLLKRFLFL